MAKHFVKQGDSARSFDFHLTLDGAPIDLTGATIMFRMRNVNGGSTLHKAATIIGAPTAGAVRVALSALETANPGSYEIENVVTFPDNSILTLPDNTYDLLDIVPNLG